MGPAINWIAGTFLCNIFHYILWQNSQTQMNSEEYYPCYIHLLISKYNQIGSPINTTTAFKVKPQDLSPFPVWWAFLQSFTIRFGLDYGRQNSHSILLIRQFHQTAHKKHLTKINTKILWYITSLLNFLPFLEHKLLSEQEQTRILRLIAVFIQHNMIKTNNIKRILISLCTLLSTTLIFQTSVTSVMSSRYGGTPKWTP